MRLLAVMVLPAIMLTMHSGCVRSLNDDSAYIMLPETGWIYGDMATFTLSHFDSVSEGNLTVAVSHDSSYLYSNLWLEISRIDGENRLIRDTLEVQFADSSGNWLGTGFGPEIEIEKPIGHIRHTSGHPINVRHIMRCDTLRGVSKIGLFFESDKDNDTRD